MNEGTMRGRKDSRSRSDEPFRKGYMRNSHKVSRSSRTLFMCRKQTEWWKVCGIPCSIALWVVRRCGDAAWCERLTVTQRRDSPTPVFFGYIQLIHYCLDFQVDKIWLTERVSGDAPWSFIQGCQKWHCPGFLPRVVTANYLLLQESKRMHWCTMNRT
jgi:hypothetical protein